MKKSEAENYIKEIIISELSQVASPEDIANQSALNKELEKTKKLASDLLENDEDDDATFDVEPTTKDIKANSSFAQLQSKYGEIIKQMKSVVNNYKSAEGSEKQQYVDELKNLTQLKKEIESLINPSMEDEEEN